MGASARCFPIDGRLRHRRKSGRRHWCHEAESGSLALGSRLRSRGTSVSRARPAPTGRTDPFRARSYPWTPDRSYMLNEQFTWLTPHSQQEMPGLTWRNRRPRSRRTRRVTSGLVGRQAAPCLRVSVLKPPPRRTPSPPSPHSPSPASVSPVDALPIVKEPARRTTSGNVAKPDDGVGTFFDRPRRNRATHVRSHPSRVNAIHEDAIATVGLGQDPCECIERSL